jgi:hypothetical protein
MDIEKVKQFLKKMLKFISILYNFMLVMCCYLAFKTIREREIDNLIFALSMFAVGICALFLTKYLKKYLFGDDD